MCVLAVDIGGTKMAVALVSKDGSIVHGQLVATPSSADPDEVYAPLDRALGEAANRAAELLADGAVLAVGIGSAGPVDRDSGTVSPVNIPAWRDFPIRARVERTLTRSGRELRTVLTGDGHCVALGEHWLGAGRGLDSMVGMIVSTGIGGGAVLGGKLYAGETGNALHVGHTSVNFLGERCECGGHGCVESYASGPAMVRRALSRGWTGVGEPDEAPTGKQLCAAAAAGDPIAGEAIDFGMRALAAAIAQLAADFDVRDFVIGGGISLAGAVVFEPLRRHVQEFNVLPFVRTLQIRPAELANASLIGAAAAAWELLA